MAIALAAVFAQPVAAHADIAKADIDASVEKTYGRMVLTFKNRGLIPQFVNKLANGVLVLQFAEPVDVNVERVPTTLGQFVMVARRDPDGQALRFALQRQVTVNTIEAGDKLFIDFLPPKWAGPPPALPDAVIQELAKRAASALKAQREAEKNQFGIRVAAKLDFRVAQLPTFSRFTFTWNVPFDTQMAREDDRITVTFNRTAVIDLAPITAMRPVGLKEIMADDSGDKLKVVFVVEPQVDVRAFREDSSYVVDLVMPVAPGSAAEQEIRKAIAAKDGLPANARQRVEAPSAAREFIQPAPAQAAAHAPAPAPVRTPAAVQPAPAAVAAAETPAPAPVAPSKAAPAVPQASRAAATQAPAETAEAAAEQPAAPAAQPAEPVAKIPAQSAPDVAETDIETPPPRADNGERIVRVEAKRIGNMVRIVFPFQEKVASAAFKRDDSLWVVFDSARQLDLAAMRANIGPLASDIVAAPQGSWQAIRIDLTQPLLTTLGADGNSWILSIGEMMLEPSRPLRLRRFVRTDGNASLRIDLPDAGKVHEIVDPKVGDRIVVVTAQAPARGLLKAQNFAQVETLASAHGIAVVPHTDDIQVLLENAQVQIGRERGLFLSTGALEESDKPVTRYSTRLHRVDITPKTFKQLGPLGFREREKEMLDALIAAPEQQRRQPRIDLAEFYIGHRFAPEALAQLRILANDDTGIERDPGFIVLYGAAQALAGRNTQANAALSRTEVADNADAALWHTISAAALTRWDEARENALKATPAVGLYPVEVQALFNLAAAEAAIELNDFGMAEGRLAEVEPDAIDNDLHAKYELLRGRLADAAGRPEDAIARFERAQDAGDRRVSAEADYRMIRLLHRDGKITTADAIGKLKSLSFGWRGDEIELKTLRFMGNLMAQEGDYRGAFTAMRSALMVDSNANTTRRFQDEMGREFVSLYLDRSKERDAKIQPVDALTLYYDFRELVPIGRQGDEVVRKLADRLIAVDLLDQAAELLSYQIDNRVKGAARAQVAADLAVVYLLNRQPERALGVLNKTRQSQLPASLERQRRLVEARAMSEIGRAENALELLTNTTGSDADRLKADILWKAKRYRDAGDRLELMLGARWSDQTALDLQEQQDVMRAGIAYVLSNDQLSLDRIRAKYTTKMSDSPNARAFDVITRPIQAQGSEFRAIAKELAAVDTMRNFLEEYRANYLGAPRTQPAPDAKPDPQAKDKPAPGPSAEAESAAKKG